MEQSVAQKNAELTLHTIHADTTTASIQLSGILAEHDKAKEALAQTRNDHQAELSQQELERTDLANKYLAFEQRTKEMGNEETRHRAELSVIEDQKKEAAKELGRLNSWIATADTELQAKREEAKTHDEKIAQAASLEESIAELQRNFAAEEQKRDAVRIETSNLLDETNIKVAHVLENARLAAEAEKQSIANRDKAEDELRTFLRDKTRVENDLRIWVARVEAKVGEVFPELRMIV